MGINFVSVFVTIGKLFYFQTSNVITLTIYPQNYAVKPIVGGLQQLDTLNGSLILTCLVVDTAIFITFTMWGYLI